jgi:hypothetical protein
MKTLFFSCIVLLVIFPVYSEEHDIIEQPISDISMDFYQEEYVQNDTIEEDTEANIPYNYSYPYIFYGLFVNAGYSDSGLENNNFTVGLNFLLFKAPPGGMIIAWTIQSFGLDYQNNNGSESIFRMAYTYYGYFAFSGLGGGISAFFNINNNNFGIAPQIGGSIFLFIVRLDYYYRYNLILNNVRNSYHETVVSVSIGTLDWGLLRERKRK